MYWQPLPGVKWHQKSIMESVCDDLDHDALQEVEPWHVECTPTAYFNTLHTTYTFSEK